MQHEPVKARACLKIKVDWVCRKDDRQQNPKNDTGRKILEESRGTDGRTQCGETAPNCPIRKTDGQPQDIGVSGEGIRPWSRNGPKSHLKNKKKKEEGRRRRRRIRRRKGNRIRRRRRIRGRRRMRRGRRGKGGGEEEEEVEGE
jgi:hypothetical protein